MLSLTLHIYLRNAPLCRLPSEMLDEAYLMGDGNAQRYLAAVYKGRALDFAKR